MKSLEDRLKAMLKQTSYQENMENTSITDSENDGVCHVCGKEAICGGLGMVRFNVPLDDWRFGKLFRCPNNSREEDIVYQERLREIGNLTAFADKTFDGFKINPHNVLTASGVDSLQSALQSAWEFSQNPQGWIIFEGTYGCGKTHLASAIGNMRLHYGENVLLITVPDLLDHLRAAYGPSSEVGYDDTFNQLKDATLLILDDLGVENPSPWAQEKLFQLLNHRYSRKLATVITTNSDINDLDPRIRSRMMDPNITQRIRITAPDYRAQIGDTSQQLKANLDNYAHMSFDNFETRDYAYPQESRTLSSALFVARKYVDKPVGWLVLIGNSGVGKTHLAASIARELHLQKREVVMINMADLLDYLRLTYDPRSKASYDQRINHVRNVSLLVLEDLWLESSSDWAREKIMQILDYRYVTKRSTIITTGKPVERHDERLQTRFLDRSITYIQVINVAEGFPARKLRR